MTPEQIQDMRRIVIDMAAILADPEADEDEKLMSESTIRSALAVGLPMLEVPCEQCSGRGWLDTGDGRDRCPHCDGAKFEPTKAGEKILSLLRHNLPVMLQDLNVLTRPPV